MRRERTRRVWLLIGTLAAVAGAAHGTAHAQDVLWVGRIGTDTAVVEAARRDGSRVTGTIINVAAGMLVQYYEAELDAEGGVRRLRSWIVPDTAVAPAPGQEPAMTVVIGPDSIRVTSAGRGGSTASSVPVVAGAVPVFDAFFNNPVALMDLALRATTARGDGVVKLYYVGGAGVEELELERTAQTQVSIPYIMARQYPMLEGVQLHARLDDDGLAQLDARETTFKIVTDRRPWADPVPLIRSYRARGLGAGGFSALSPPRAATGRIGTVDVEVRYGQPSRRGRTIFPDVVPYGVVWRAGANAATEVTFSADVRVAGEPVPAGTYSLWVLPGERADTLIVNRATRIWGVSYDAAQDLVRVPLRRERLDDRVESLVYEITGEGGAGRLSLAWDERRMSVAVEPATR